LTDRASIRRGDLIIAEMPDAAGRQTRKRRPYVVVSPDDLNAAGLTYIAAPLTTGNYPYRFRVPCTALGRRGHVVLDQLYTVNASDVRRAIGQLNAATIRSMLVRLREMFAE
jgi:mRNA interferase MazF